MASDQNQEQKNDQDQVHKLNLSDDSCDDTEPDNEMFKCPPPPPEIPVLFSRFAPRTPPPILVLDDFSHHRARDEDHHRTKSDRRDQRDHRRRSRSRSPKRSSRRASSKTRPSSRNRETTRSHVGYATKPPPQRTSWEQQEKEWLSTRQPPPLPPSIPLDVNEERWDPNTNSTYYVNRFWRTSTWTKPSGFVLRPNKKR